MRVSSMYRFFGPGDARVIWAGKKLREEVLLYDHEEAARTGRDRPLPPLETVAKYPRNWKEISRSIRDRSGGRCECTGECGLHCFHGGPRRCVEVDGRQGLWMQGTVMLTVAHLNARGGPCQCEPRCGDPDHLKAMCQRCHLRYDRGRHSMNARLRRAREAGQREMFHGED